MVLWGLWMSGCSVSDPYPSPPLPHLPLETTQPTFYELPTQIRHNRFVVSQGNARCKIPVVHSLAWQKKKPHIRLSPVLSGISPVNDTLWVSNMWVRFKAHERLLSESSLSCICPFRLKPGACSLKYEHWEISEFRAPWDYQALTRGCWTNLNEDRWHKCWLSYAVSDHLTQCCALISVPSGQACFPPPDINWGFSCYIFLSDRIKSA